MAEGPPPCQNAFYTEVRQAVHKQIGSTRADGQGDQAGPDLKP